VGSVTITANGGQTGDLLAKIVAASASYTVVTVGAGATSLPSPTGTGPFELVIDPGDTGTMSIPSGYALVVNGATGDTHPITGGDATTAIVGGDTQPLDYSGPAGTVLGAGGGGTITDTSNAALMAFLGNVSVTADGNGDTIGVDGGNSTFDLVGSGEVINTGGGAPSVASGAAAAAAAVTSTQTFDINATSTGDVMNIASGASDLIFAVAPFTINQSGGSSTVVTGAGGHVTLNGTGGSEVVFDHDGSNLINAGPSTEYVTAIDVAASTYNAAAGGADTIFASSAIDYSSAAGTANSLFFLGGAGAVTVSAAAAETVFGGAGGGSYSIGATSFSFFGGGGADTLTGATGAASVLAFGDTNENLTIDQAAGTKGNTLIPFGNNDSINASLAAGGNTWQVVNQTLPSGIGGTFTGNSTLVGSTAGSDLFVVYIDPAASSLPPAHTIDIANWQSSDNLFLSDLGNSNQSLDATDLSAVNAFDAGTAKTLTLSDGTTIDFTGARPNTIAHV
jgi:hypothetical protein